MISGQISDQILSKSSLLLLVSSTLPTLASSNSFGPLQNKSVGMSGSCMRPIVMNREGKGPGTDVKTYSDRT